MTFNLDQKHLLMYPDEHHFLSQRPSSVHIQQGKNKLALDFAMDDQIPIQLNLEVINDTLVYTISDSSGEYLPYTVAGHLKIPQTEAQREELDL